MQILTKQQAEHFLIQNISSELNTVSNALIQKNIEIFLVGGSVRDAFFNKVPKDFDLATNAMPELVMETLTAANIHCEPRGVEFGVIVARINNEEFEIATFRSDISGGTGNLMDDQVILGVSIEEDVQRRDLTINGLFFDFKTQEIIDLVGGIEDLHNGLIKTIGNPIDRFRDDSTRKLRVIRFAARYSFDIDTNTQSAIKKDPSLKCNNERIMLELDKIFSTDSNLKWVVSILDHLGLTQEIFKSCTLNNFKLANVIKVNSISTFIATVVENTEKNITLLTDIVKSTDIINNVKLLWELNVSNDELLNNVMLVDVLRKLKSCTLTMDEAITFTKNKDVMFFFHDDMKDKLKQFNQQAIQNGLKGKEIGDWTKEQMQSLLQFSFLK